MATVLPIEKDHFNYSSTQFRDGLACVIKNLFYNFLLFVMDVELNLQLVMLWTCRRGGLVVQWHNEVRDVICDTAALAWN